MRGGPEAPRLRVSVVLPTLNEGGNIARLLDQIYEAIPDLHETIVVDDDSSDGTQEEVRAYMAAHPRTRILLEVRKTDQGLTKSIAHGVSVATGDIVVWMDCDLSMPPSLIPSLLHGIDEGFDAVVGSRFVAGGSFKRDTEGTPDSALAVILSRIMNYAIQVILDHRFKDYTSGFIAIRRAIVLDLGLRGSYGEYFIDLMFRAIRTGYAVLEVPYVCVPRRRGVSKTGTNLWQYLGRGRAYVVTALGLRLQAIAGRARRPRLSLTTEAPTASPAEIRPMHADDVPFVAGLHQRVLFDTLNSKLGSHFLSRLYRGLLDDPKARCWVAVAAERHAGFVSVTRDLHATDARLRAAVPLRERAIVAAHLLISASNLRSFFAHGALLRWARSQGHPYPTILTLGVSPDQWGTGLAARLVDAVRADLRRERVQRVWVDAAAGNLRAVAFYEKIGFSRVANVAENIVFRRPTGPD